MEEMEKYVDENGLEEIIISSQEQQECEMKSYANLPTPVWHAL